MAARTPWMAVAVGSLMAALPASALAGMPAPLPFNVEQMLVPQLKQQPLERLQAVSFFLGVFLLSALVVMLLWNYLQRDFHWLPRLSFGKAAAGVFLWGLLFIIVLTMISGARELMTPGAWEKQGFTYRLTGPAVSPASSEAVSP